MDGLVGAWPTALIWASKRCHEDVDDDDDDDDYANGAVVLVTESKVLLATGDSL